MQVIKYEAHNVMGVKDVKFDLAGRHLFLVGGANGNGKSSALTGLVAALAGKSGMPDYPAILLRKGQKKGKVTIELTGDSELMESKSITVELSLRQKASGAIVEEFRVLDSAGEEAPEPRKLLQRLFTLRAFDPLAFERMKPKEKATLVQEMLGLDLSKYDKEHKTVFEQRTDLGRDGKKLAAQLEAAGDRHEGVGMDEVKVVELMGELDKLGEESKSRANMEKLVYDRQQDQVRLAGDATYMEVKIAEMQAELAEMKGQIVVAKEAEKEASKKLESLPDRTPDIAAVKEKIAKADETNRKVRANEALDKLETEVKKSRGDYQKLTDRLNEIQEERAEVVANAEWPIEGMELNEDGLLMGGLPFEQASTSQRIMASVAVGMALNPKLRLMVSQHGSDLDNATLDALGKAVEASNFLLLLEIVTRTCEDEERCAVVIEDGLVKGSSDDVEQSEELQEGA